MRRVALFFGSFNPIHNGHLILANYIAEYCDVDEVRFVVSPQNPFKQDKRLLPDKLRLELASLTSGSKIVVGVLLGMPFLFVLVISIINPGYFMPFFNTNIGLILLIFMLIYYIIFVVVVRKIMKVVI